MNVSLAIEMEAGAWPAREQLEPRVEEAVAATAAELPILASAPTELSVLFTDDAGIRALNSEWRGKDKATNVLSFPAFPHRTGTLPPLLGDIVVARETVEREAAAEDKAFDHHLSHLIVHGLLHLLGYDHEEEEAAEEMESLERRILARLAIPDPYL